MDLIKIVDAKTGEPMGTMNWFSVHATSMKSTSGLISGAESDFSKVLGKTIMNRCGGFLHPKWMMDGL